MGPRSISSLLRPLRSDSFRLLFLSTLVSSFGTLVAAVALTVDVQDRTDSGLWVGALLVADFLPAILVGLALGPLLDRLSRRGLMVGADLVRAAVDWSSRRGTRASSAAETRNETPLIQ